MSTSYVAYTYMYVALCDIYTIYNIHIQHIYIYYCDMIWPP